MGIVPRSWNLFASKQYEFELSFVFDFDFPLLFSWVFWTVSFTFFVTCSDRLGSEGWVPARQP